MNDRRTPRVLALLFETVDDHRIFGLDFVREKERFRDECLEIFDHLYSNAVRRWNTLLDPARDAAHSEHPGVLLFERFPQLTTCWIESFENGIREVARRRDLPETDDRDFLYFMLGYMQCGAEEAGRRYREVRETGALKVPRLGDSLWWMRGDETPRHVIDDQLPLFPRPEPGPWWMDRNGTPEDAEADEPPF